MNPAEYIESVRELLLTSPIVESFHIVRQRVTSFDGHMRARLILLDGLLEFSEYFQRTAGGPVQVVTYSYQWLDADNRLIRRWDNTPHFPDLPGYPHHIHDEVAGAVIPGEPVDIFSVLEHVTRHLVN